MNPSSEIPEWLLTTEEYEPDNDRDHFIGKSIMEVLKLLERFRMNGSIRPSKMNTSVRLLLVILLILVSSVSTNMAVTYVILAGFAVRLALLNAKQIRLVLQTGIMTFLLSALLLLPSVFLGSPKTLLTVSIKAFLSVGLLQCLAVSTPWNQLTKALRSFHVPGVFILTLDLTLKYIRILGTMCQEMLEALKLRSIGKNPRKSQAATGILGVTFLKSQEMAEEMYGAMVCRGFDGEYNPDTCSSDSGSK